MGKQFFMQNKVNSPTLTLDGDLISQVHSNLIANAIRYAVASVTLCLEETQDGLLLSVSDDGMISLPIILSQINCLQNWCCCHDKNRLSLIGR